MLSKKIAAVLNCDGRVIGATVAHKGQLSLMNEGKYPLSRQRKHITEAKKYAYGGGVYAEGFMENPKRLPCTPNDDIEVPLWGEYGE